MYEEHNFADCPPEDVVERWAVQTVQDREAEEWKTHLILCVSCHSLHRQFVDFYTDVARGDHNNFSLINIGNLSTPSPGRTEIKRIVQTMRPLDPAVKAVDCRVPVAFSQTLVTDQRSAESGDTPFVSSDGIVAGKLLGHKNGLDSSFQLMSPDLRFVRRALLHFPENDHTFQSDDSGSVSFLPTTGITQEVQIIEVLPFAVEAAYSSCPHGDTAVIPALAEMDGGVLGTIVLEQEEGDNKEAILRIAFPEFPADLLDARLFIALADDLHTPFVDEAVGREVYLYGPDLFRDFRLWVYLR